MNLLVTLVVSFLSGAPQTACQTTRGNDTHPPAAVLAKAGVGETGLHGNGKVWTYAWPDDTVTFQKGGPGFVERDGSLKMKFFWLMATDGPIAVTGRRLDATAPPLRTEMAAGFLGAGFQPSYVIFPAPDCWEVTAKANGSEFRFVTKVVKTF